MLYSEEPLYKNTDKSSQYIDYKKVYHDIVSTTYADVYWKGTPSYYQRIKLENGLCSNIFPDLVVVPKSTKAVAYIVKISRQYNVPLSVRSGGHSYICAKLHSLLIQVTIKEQIRQLL